jgi:light-regulated signal transduction histidine kinase (bacteriophytochrome)
MARIDKDFVAKTAVDSGAKHAMHAEPGQWINALEATADAGANRPIESFAQDLTITAGHNNGSPDAFFNLLNQTAAVSTFPEIQSNSWDSSGLSMEAKARTDEMRAANEHLRAAQAELSERVSALEVRLMREVSRQEEDARDMEAVIRAITCGQPIERFLPQLLRYRSVSCRRPPCNSISLEIPVAAAVGERLHIIAARRAEVHWGQSMPSVLADQTLLQEVVRSLLDNALTFVAPDVMPRVRLWTENGEGKVRLYMEDNGVGIAPEHHECIFGLFECLGSGPMRAGIGLAIVRKAMNQMNGSAGVDSSPGAGSRFWIELPAGH